MMLVLLIAGIGFVLAGIVAVLFGIPVKEFSFGNTLILVGVVAICTGMILVALAAVVGELRLIARRLAPRSGAEPRARDFLPSSAPAEASFPLTRDQSAGDEVTGDAASAALPGAPPWRDEAAARGRQETPSGEQASSEAAQGAKPRRNLLFSSTSRKERERAQGRAPGPSPSAPPAMESGEVPPANFEDAWPRAERARTGELPPRRPGRMPPNPAESNAPAAGGERSAARNEGPPAVTVLKSGVVDGMAYSLYSDGSIEAQMPEGMMRFASIDALRAHLDQRS